MSIIYNNCYKVYCHIFPNNKFYIGVTKQELEKRFLKGAGYSHNPIMERAIKKYGWNNIEHLVIADNLTQKEAFNFEKILIQELQTRDIKFGYNISPGGFGSSRSIVDDKKILELWNEGNSITEIHNITKHDYRPIIHSLQRSKIPTELFWKRGLQKRSNNKLEKFPVAELYKDYINGESLKTLLKKYHTSINMINRILQDHYDWDFCQEKRKITRPFKKKRCGRKPKAIQQYLKTGEHITTFLNAAEALKFLEINISKNTLGCIQEVCRGRRKTYLGYVWKYLEE